MPYAVFAHYRCEPADELVVREALLRMREFTRGEPANLAYEVHAEAERVGGFVLYEVYADRAGFEAHAAADYFDELIVRTVRPLLTERTVTFAEVLQNSLPQQ
ncbi:antibiotic biosynthesis monooxygenase [Streptomyces cinnabarinus]|uniref:Antibiotic biosynthesis monooxygenase n=1 Tax=Streptomyces cinnabarinus TaxID=67287 RepID=A0ABY7KLP8_9ACTN|nr:antibiotic biosynthesis monooxygenase [Streptomyces cinnabarinus]WAZ25483.1 antibiotic biosynthesis monooxygenase [Streptomyces cinnabarinus]